MILQLLSLFYSLTDTLLLIIKEMGYLGIFIGMAIESSFFPLPSELILLPAGVLIAQGQMNLFLVLLFSVLGSVLGALINYFLALFLGRTAVNFLIDKYGRFLFLDKKGLKKTDEYFATHGEVTTFIGRLIPLVRHLISLPAGFAKMNIWKFCIFTALGAGTWTLVLVFTGMFFGGDSQPIIKIVTGIILAVLTIIGVVYYLIRRKKVNRIINKELK